MVKTIGVETLQEGIPGECDGDHVAHGGVTAQHAHRIITRTRILGFVAVIRRHAESHLVNIYAPHKVFELGVDGCAVVAVFGILLRRARPIRLRVRCRLLITGASGRLPKGLLMRDRPGRIAMEIAILGISLGTDTSQIAAAQMLESA